MESIFSTLNHIEVVIKTGSNESIDDILKRYSYIFSDEKAARIYEPELNERWAYESSFEIKQRLQKYFEKNDTPFGIDGDSPILVQLKKEEAEKMTRLLFFPPRDEQIRSNRHELISEFINRPDLDSLIHLKTQALSVVEGLIYINQFVTDNDRLLELYYSGVEYMPEDDDDAWAFEKKEREPEDTVQYEVTKDMHSITFGLDALETLGHMFASSQDGAINSYCGNLIQRIENWQQTLYPCIPLDNTPSIENAHGYDAEVISRVSSEIRGYLVALGGALEWAKKIRDESWGAFTTDESLPDRYEGSWNIEEQKDGQTLNYFPQDERFCVVSGPITSGKSYWKRSDLFLRLATQSFNYGPAEHGGNIHPHDAYYFIERVTSDPDRELSAYMNEIDAYAQILPRMPARSRLYLDEGGSTTSPDGQARIVFGIGTDVINRGGSVVVGTHNDELLAYLYDHGYRVYRMATSIDENGELVRYFILEEGIGDSHSIEAAKAMHLPARFIHHAENYLHGTIESPEIPSRTYAEIRKFLETEREQLKSESIGLDHMFTPSHDPLFVLFSADKDFQPENILRHKQASPDITLRGFDEYTLKEWIGTMIIQGGSVSSEELLERQQMFTELVHEQSYRDILLRLGDVIFIEQVMREIQKCSNVGINIGLNPFQKDFARDETGAIIADIPEYLEAAVAYLQIQKKLLGHSFPAEDLLWQTTTLLGLYQMVQHRTDSWYIEDSVNLTDEELQVSSLLDDSSQDKSIRSVNDIALNILQEVQHGNYRFASVSYPDIQIASIEEELRVLESFQSKREPWRKPTGAFNDVNKILSSGLFAEGGLPRALLHFPGMVQDVEMLTKTLRSKDSVYLHQLANAIDVHIEESIEAIQMGVSYKVNRDLERYFTQLASVSYFAAIIDYEKFVPVDFNNTGDVVFEDLSPVSIERSKGIHTTITIPVNESARIITGPNGSGKTVIEKEMSIIVPMGLSSGFVPCKKFCTMPVFDKIVYFDRIVRRDDTTFSSGAQEMRQWEKLISLANSNYNIFMAAAIDELGSTMSPRYQAGFSYAMLKTFMESAQKIWLSTHNHAFVHTILNAGIQGIAPFHLSFELTEKGIMFHRQLVEGVADSYPLQIAAMNSQFPSNILQIAAEMDI